METLTNDQIRKAVLEILYDQEDKCPDPGDPLWSNFALQEKLQVSNAQVNACIYYLEQKGLITMYKRSIESFGPDFLQKYSNIIQGNAKIFIGPQENLKFRNPPPLYLLKITALGIDVVESKDKFAKEFPFMNVTIQNISGILQNIGGNNYAPVTATQGDQNVITINQQITDAFKQAYDKVKDSELPPQQKEAINRKLKEMEQELHKEDKADVGKIHKISKWLKDNANWIVPIVSNAIKKGLDLACGI
jgi:hypothetical protein